MNPNPMEDFRADLHCHSTYSDGTCTPLEIIDLAIQKRLQGLSITDHDTIGAYKEAIPYAQEKHIDLISGIEFSADHKGESVHVLGYAFPPFHPAIESLCLEHSLRRKVRNHEMLEKLSSLGMSITMHDVEQAAGSKLETIGRPHIANAMLKKGYVASFKEAFKLYLGEGKLAYVKGTPISVEKTLDTIHAAHGLAFIAHPHLIESSRLKSQLLEMDFDGIEVYYGTFNRDDHERWLHIAQKKGWLISGGSDFHGGIKPNVSLGCSWVSLEHFSILKKHYLQYSA